MGTKRVEEREEEEEWETERVSLSVAQPVWSFPPWDITSRWRMPRDESGRALQTLWWNSKWVKKTLYFDIEAARGAGTTLNTACQLVDVLTSRSLSAAPHMRSSSALQSCWCQQVIYFQSFHPAANRHVGYICDAERRRGRLQRGAPAQTDRQQEQPGRSRDGDGEGQREETHRDNWSGFIQKKTSGRLRPPLPLPG